MFKNSKGFTLIEMLVVLLIISVLLILIVPNLSKRSGDVHGKGCDALVEVVQAQVDLFTIVEEENPLDLNDLQEKGYIKEEQLSCGNGIELELNSGQVVKK